MSLDSLVPEIMKKNLVSQRGKSELGTSSFVFSKRSSKYVQFRWSVKLYVFWIMHYCGHFGSSYNTWGPFITNCRSGLYGTIVRLSMCTISLSGTAVALEENETNQQVQAVCLYVVRSFKNFLNALFKNSKHKITAWMTSKPL